MQVKRVRDKIKEMANVSNITSAPEAVTELDKKVKEAVRFYR